MPKNKRNDGATVWSLTGAKVAPVAGAWDIVNGIPSLKPNVDPDQNALSVTAQSIIKNGEPLTGHSINLTVAHLRSEGFAMVGPNADGTMTITRNEGKRGAKRTTGLTADSLSTFLAAVKA